MELSKFIKNIKDVKDEGMIGICEKEIKDLFYEVLSNVAKRTIVDTGQSASSVIRKYADQNGYQYRHLLAEPLRYWGNSDRGIGKANTDLSQDFSAKKAIVELNINDEGLYFQENANETKNEYPSEKPNRDNGSYIPHHITYVINVIWKQPEVIKLIEEMKIKIEKEFFK